MIVFDLLFLDGTSVSLVTYPAAPSRAHDRASHGGGSLKP
jgi:hypothetical protein